MYLDILICIMFSCFGNNTKLINEHVDMNKHFNIRGLRKTEKSAMWSTRKSFKTSDEN